MVEPPVSESGIAACVVAYAVVPSWSVNLQTTPAPGYMPELTTKSPGRIRRKPVKLTQLSLVNPASVVTVTSPPVDEPTWPNTGLRRPRCDPVPPEPGGPGGPCGPV